MIDIHPLAALAVQLLWLGNYGLLKERVDDLRRQLRQPSHLSDPLDELRITGFVGGVQALWALLFLRLPPDFCNRPDFVLWRRFISNKK